jgi:hypothetical protein
MSELTDHYRRLLGLDAAWEVTKVDFQPDEKRVEIAIVYVGGRLVYPGCGESCSQADKGEERSRRHLDTMQFETRIRAAAPRSDCRACGVRRWPSPGRASIPDSRFSSRPVRDGGRIVVRGHEVLRV